MYFFKIFFIFSAALKNQIKSECVYSSNLYSTYNSSNRINNNIRNNSSKKLSFGDDLEHENERNEKAFMTNTFTNRFNGNSYQNSNKNTGKTNSIIEGTNIINSAHNFEIGDKKPTEKLKNLEILNNDNKDLLYNSNSNLKGVNTVNQHNLLFNSVNNINHNYDELAKSLNMENTSVIIEPKKGRVSPFKKLNKRSQSQTDYQELLPLKNNLGNFYESILVKNQDTNKINIIKQNKNALLNLSLDDLSISPKKQAFILENGFNSLFNKTHKNLNFKTAFLERVEKVKAMKYTNNNSNNINIHSNAPQQKVEDNKHLLGSLLSKEANNNYNACSIKVNPNASADNYNTNNFKQEDNIALKLKSMQSLKNENLINENSLKKTLEYQNKLKELDINLNINDVNYDLAGKNIFSSLAQKKNENKNNESTFEIITNNSIPKNEVTKKISSFQNISKEARNKLNQINLITDDLMHLTNKDKEKKQQEDLNNFKASDKSLNQSKAIDQSLIRRN